MSKPTIHLGAVAAGCTAAHAWHTDLIDRLESVSRTTGTKGYCVASGLREAFNVLPIDQQGAFLDAVGAYLMTCHAIGRPTRKAHITPELLAVYASTPAEQRAWGDAQNDEDDDE